MNTFVSAHSVLKKIGDVSVEDFLANDWHVRPVLFRHAIDGFEPFASVDELLTLPSRPEVESRLITSFKGQWKMKHGPLESLPALKKPEWTVLVQGLNMHLPAADALLNRFRFVPDARLDDLMVSIASDGGGVGPHFDSYDVFLLQMHGHRRWRISQQKDLRLQEDVPVKLLKHFKPTEEFVLGPGDMLYLPPHWAHEGVAQGVCSTLSIGFRAPNSAEVLASVLRSIADEVELDESLQALRFSDPQRGLSKKPAELPEDLTEWAENQLSKYAPSIEAIQKGLALSLTEPKQNVFFEPLEQPLSQKKLLQNTSKLGVRLSPKTRAMYQGSDFFVNGEHFEAEGKTMQKAVQTLLNQRYLTAEQLKPFELDVQWVRWLQAMVDAGWLLVGVPD